ncbi:MAG: ribose 5-phosphate isomerase B [Chloroflexi bacterium]|nr:ribose 5-phosphate isomerase B [Chloroflexota bacterium]
MDYISDSEIQGIVKNVLEKYNESDGKPRSGNCAKIVAIGADHGGFNMKQALIPYLEEMGCKVIDCGPADNESVDYPDFAFKVAELVSTGNACRGIMIDGAGIGSCMVANKVPGVRAALCYDYATASNSREHNNANYLTLGAGLIGLNQAKLIVKTFLTTDFGGGRHQKRVDKIMEVENRFLKRG